MLYKQNFTYQLLVFLSIFHTTSRYQSTPIFDTKNKNWNSIETKYTLFFIPRSDSVAHLAIMNIGT